MVVVACCCCIPYQLALMLAPTFAPCVLTFAHYILTFGPCACGVSLLSTGANIPLAQVVVVTSCNLRRWYFFIQPLAQIVHLNMWWHHPLQLALVVLFHIQPYPVYSGDRCMWRQNLSIYLHILIKIYVSVHK